MTPSPETLRDVAEHLRIVQCPDTARAVDAHADAWELAEKTLDVFGKAGIDWRRWGKLLVKEENKSAALRKRLAEVEQMRVADNERLHGHLLLLEETIRFALADKAGWDLRAKAMLDPFNRDAALAGEERP